MHARPVLTLLFVCLVGVALASPTNARTIQLAEGALAFDAPADWESVQPANRILEHELSVNPPEGVDAKPARLTIMAAGGGVEANLARWVGQFQKPTAEPKKDELEAGGMPVSTLELKGTYLDAARGPFGPKTPRPGYRLVGAIVKTDGEGVYFFKLIGPDETVEPAAEKFREMIKTLRKK